MLSRKTQRETRKMSEAEHKSKLEPDPICENCGNDLACEGETMCLECLEAEAGETESDAGN